MSNKIGRNELCPCGSGKKFKKCCLGKDGVLTIINQPPDIEYELGEAMKKSRFKECLFPDKSKCSKIIRKAHSIQRNKILDKIDEEGIVFMPEFKPNLKYEFGIKVATTFQGFCEYHDKKIFQPIEDFDFDKSDYHVFLHIYRVFAHAYHKKREGIRIFEYFLNSPKYNDEQKRLLRQMQYSEQIFIRNIKKERKIIEAAIMNQKYELLNSIIWELPYQTNFAGTGIEALKYDFDGRLIQNIHDEKCFAKHLYLSVFPESNKTYVIIAWLKESDLLFKNVSNKLSHLNNNEKENFISNTLPIMSRNIVIKPSAWNRLSQRQKDHFNFLINNGIDIIESQGKIINRLAEPSFNLFKL